MKEYISLPNLPAECSDLQPNEWRKNQAQSYFDWFTSIVPERVRNFMDYFELPDNPIPDKDYVLGVIKKVCTEILNNEWFTYYTKGTTGEIAKQLIGKGYSVAIDCGLYFLHLGERHFNKPYEYLIYTKYPKNYRQRNLPHFRNLMNGACLDPQEFGINIALYGIHHMNDLSFLLNTFRNYTGVDSERI